MDTLRKKNIEKLASPAELPLFKKSLSSDFGENVFNNRQLQRYISDHAFKQMQLSIEKGTPMGTALADQIASAMKAWAINKGATHYSHWFQPLSGTTAEKHESFFDLDASGAQIEKFDGEQLVQQIPNASSFPSGGFEIHLKHEAIQLGIPLPLHLSMKIRCVYPLFLSLIQEKHLITKHPLSSRFKS